MIDPNLVTTTRVGELPTSLFSLTDLIPHEVGEDLKSGTIQQLLDLLRPLVGKLQFEVVRMSVTAQYIADNFDVTGLGTDLCLGFAICNGNNGTENLDGRSGIGYGSNYNFVGLTGGGANAVVVSHSHGNRYQTKNASGSGSERVLDNSGVSTLIQNTDSVGESGINKNYHPYIVQLYMMKL